MPWGLKYCFEIQYFHYSIWSINKDKFVYQDGNFVKVNNTVTCGVHRRYCCLPKNQTSNVALVKKKRLIQVLFCCRPRSVTLVPKTVRFRRPGCCRWDNSRCPPTQTPKHKSKSRFSMFGSKEIGTRSVSFLMIF